MEINGDQTSISSSTVASTSHVPELMCPSCGYNLHGLGSGFIDCPECGQRCDVAMLKTHGWNRRWSEAPGYAAIARPGVWAGTTSLLLCIIALITLFVHDQLAIVTLMIGGLVIFVSWIHLMRRAARTLMGWQGLWLALLYQAMLVVFWTSLFGVSTLLLIAFVSLAAALAEQSLMGGIAGLALLGLSVMLVFASIRFCRFVDQYIGRCCIRCYFAARGTAIDDREKS